MFNVPIPDLPVKDSSTGIHEREQDNAPASPPPGPVHLETGISKEPLSTSQAQPLPKSTSGKSRAGKKKKHRHSREREHEIRLDLGDDVFYNDDYDVGDTIAGTASATENAALKRRLIAERNDQRGQRRNQRYLHAGAGGVDMVEEEEGRDIFYCPESLTKDCLYITTMFMNMLYAIVCGIIAMFIVANRTGNIVLELISLVLAGLCVVCFVADTILYCKLSAHKFMADLCPVVFWLACNAIFLLLNFAQLVTAIILWIQYKEIINAEAGLIAALVGFLIFSLFCFILRTWFVLIVNHSRRDIQHHLGHLEATVQRRRTLDPDEGQGSSSGGGGSGPGGKDNTIPADANRRVKDSLATTRSLVMIQ